MGMTDVEARIRKAETEASSRLRAAKRAGHAVDGAEFVATEGITQKRCLVVRSGQVEILTRRTTGYYEEKRERMVIPIRDVTKVEVHESSKYEAMLEVVAATGGISLKTQPGVALLGKRIIDRFRAATPVVPQGSPTDTSSPLETLRTLKQLRDEGLITDEEYEAKRVEVLQRM
jgi:hypothetical protein